MRSVSALVFVSPTLAILAVAAAAEAPDTTDSAVMPNASPAWLANIQGPSYLDHTGQYMFNANTPSEDDEDEEKDEEDGDTFKDLLGSSGITAEQLAGESGGFPSLEGLPDPSHPEVQAVIAALDWDKVPNAPQRTLKGPGELDMADYDQDDPDCWWSSTLCSEPKQADLPADISYCPRVGDWGLNYDDGPFAVDSEPRLYNFLASSDNQKATLFYIGTNVIQYPEAAQRALADGHTICSHTWSHQFMTTLTNEEIVAELYWTQKAIKTVLGITPKCWRPPFGDVDDRVRAIAWQMGMRTFLWDQDTNDWGLVSQSIDRSSVDGAFKKWIRQSKAGTHGHITLQHESDLSAIQVSEHWLPKLQKYFNVMTIHQCINDPYPYWEDNWAYPDDAVAVAVAVDGPKIQAASVRDPNSTDQSRMHHRNSAKPLPSSSSSNPISPPLASLLFILMFNVAASAAFYWRY